MIGAALNERYRVLREIGRGGMGVVYQAHDQMLDREVALKVVGHGHADAASRERFLREARAIAKMDHPGIVPVYDLGVHDGRAYLVMPFVLGESLRALLDEGTLRLRDVLDLGLQLARALEHCHARGVVHRDVKPDNVLVDRDGETDSWRARLTDFGLALGGGERRLTASGEIIGTFEYVSPEQVLGEVPDGRADVYALGTLLYECLVGDPPFVGATQAVLYRIVHERPPPIDRNMREIDAELAALVMACLAKRPAERPGSAELATSLEQCLASALERPASNDKITTSRLRADERPVVRPASPFVGREKELAELHGRLGAALGGEAQLCLVGGPSGSGKTRLLDELERLAEVRGVRSHRALFAEHGAAMPYQGFCDVIEQHCRARTRSGGEGVADLADLGEELVQLFPVLAEVPGLGAARPAERGGDSDPDAMLERSPLVRRNEVLARALARMAERTPLAILMEELDACSASLEALAYVLRRAAASPILFVGTYDPAAVERGHALRRLRDDFRASARFAHLELGPLSASEHAELIAALLPGARVAQALAARLYALTEGNPYFAVEIARGLIEARAVHRSEDGTWTVSGDDALSVESLPETVNKAVEARIARLPEAMHELLERASVLGESFGERELADLSEAGASLDEPVDGLVRAGFFEEQAGPGGRLAFASAIVRRAVYAGVPRRRRRRLHRLAAEALERRHEGRLDRVYPRLLRHWVEAEDVGKVASVGLALGERALEARALDQAAEAARTVLGFVSEEGDHRESEARARLLLGRTLRAGGDLAGAERELEAAAALAEEVSDTPTELEALGAAADAAWEARRLADLERLVDRAVPLARTLGHPSLEKLLRLAAAAATLRGDGETSARLRGEAERLRAASLPPPAVDLAGEPLSVAFGAEVTAVDPALCDSLWDFEISGNVFEPLVATDESGEPIPWLCERSEGEGRRHRFYLRPGVLLHDGRELSAALVKGAFERTIRKRREGLPAAFSHLEGVGEFVAGLAREVTGLSVHGEQVLGMTLREPVPIFVALLTDPATAVACPGSIGLAGTGPFTVAEREPSRLVLARNERYWGGTPRLGSLAFSHGRRGDDLAEGFRARRYDLVQGLTSAEIDALLADRRVSARMVDIPAKHLRFALLNCARPIARNAYFRHALFGAVPVQALVHRHVGPYARPASGVLPPGLLGHDPARREAPLLREQARSLLQSAGMPLGVRLSAAVTPGAVRHAALLDAIRDSWSAVGVEVAMETVPVEALSHRAGPAGVDVVIAGWAAGFEDPDAFMGGLFHSRDGGYRHWLSSPELDRLIEEARREPAADRRVRLYRRMESILVDEHWLLPLVFDTDVRLAQASLGRPRTLPLPPYVRYGDIVKASAPARRVGGGELILPFRTDTGQVGVDPTRAGVDPTRVTTIPEAELVDCCFETLMREVEAARVVPWLARAVEPEDAGRRWRIRLREDVRFHDGRVLGARDVRWSWERAIRRAGGRLAAPLASIAGARELLAGTSASLEGVHIVSETELLVAIDPPSALFPVMLTYGVTSVVPEGTAELGPSWRAGCVGTGPFRLERLAPGESVELAAHPLYWRPGHPRADRLKFLLPAAQEDKAVWLRTGACSLACGFDDVSALGREARAGCTLYQRPVPMTAALFFNVRRGAFRREPLRALVARSIDVEALVSGQLAGRAVAARSFTPPELLGGPPPVATGRRRLGTSPGSLRIRCGCTAVFRASWPAALGAILETLSRIGFSVETVDATPAIDAELDAMLMGWSADYPDPDSMLGVLHTRDGYLGAFSGMAKLDALIEEARGEGEPRARRQLYVEAERLIAERVLLVPLFHPLLSIALRPEVRGYEEGALPALSRPWIDHAALWVEA
jgi:ABC-type transport system substrate-binding protein